MESFKQAKLYDASGDLTKRWYVEYFYLHPETKKFVRFKEFISSRLGTRGGRKHRGQELITAINNRLQSGYNPFSAQEKRFSTVAEALDFILGLKQSSCRLRTYTSYKSLVKKLKLWLDASGHRGLHIKDFTPMMAQQFIDDSKRLYKLANRTHNDYVVHVRGFFKMLKKRQWIYLNPFEDIEKLPATEPDIISFTPQELALMVETLPLWDYNLYAAACMIFYGFLRPQELVGLTVGHLLLRQNLILVPGYVSKNKKSETIQIPPGLRPVLENLDLNYPQSDFLFSRGLNRGSKAIAPTRMAEAWREYADQVGIDKNMYALKHTGNGMAIDAGVNLRDLQLHNRHHSLDMTQRYADRFRKHTSDELNEKFPDLTQISGPPTNKTSPFHYIPLGEKYNPELSKN